MNDAAVKKIMDEIQKNKEELKNAIKASETRLLLTHENLKTKVHDLEKENFSLRNKVEFLEKGSKENNIVIFGIDLDEEVSVEHVLQELNNRLEIDITYKDINNIYRLGKNKECPVETAFISYLTKKNVLQNAKKLKGSGISIVHDPHNKRTRRIQNFEKIPVGKKRERRKELLH